MRLCRSQQNGIVEVAFYHDTFVVSLPRLASALTVGGPSRLSTHPLDYLPPEGGFAALASDLATRYAALAPTDQERLRTPRDQVQILVPIPDPKKVILLAGNYAEHIREGGGVAAERAQTFPYFFWKPPSTTLTHPDDPVRIPAV